MILILGLLVSHLLMVRLNLPFRIFKGVDLSHNPVFLSFNMFKEKLSQSLTF